MFRITTQKLRDVTVVTLDGSLTDSDVDEVHRVLCSVKAPAALNLSDLESCSNGVVSELRLWLEGGFTLQGATPFVRLLLANHPVGN